VNVKLGLVLQLGNGVELSLQSILNDICPAILPLGLTFAIYYMLKKGVKPVSIMLGIIVFGVAAKFFGIM
ncbi:MAG: PTS system mannose/fructose/sorbose family transporter subunit IID, partial [Longicatena sp.]